MMKSGSSLSKMAHCQEEDARKQALAIVGLFRMLRGMLAPGVDPRKFARLLEKALTDPDALEAQLIQEFLREPPPLEETRKTNEMLAMAQAQPRKFFAEVMRSEFPHGTPGRKKVLTPEIKLAAVDIAEGIFPALRAFVLTQSRISKRTTKEVVNFLAPDFPRPCEFLLDRIPQLEALLDNKRFMKGAKSNDGRAKLLAYALAGGEFGLSPSYAVREIRAAIFSRERKTKDPK